MSPHIEFQQNQVVAFCRKWRVQEFALFGSVLSHDFGPESDVDVLVTFDPDAPWSLLEWVDMTDELKLIFGRDVHLLEKAALRNPFRRHAILTAKKVIYAT